jgi:hypothetical protein
MSRVRYSCYTGVLHTGIPKENKRKKNAKPENCTGLCVGPHEVVDGDKENKYHLCDTCEYEWRGPIQPNAKPLQEE